jgi:hypothetical protein
MRTWTPRERVLSWLELHPLAWDVVTAFVCLVILAAAWLPWWLPAQHQWKDWYVKVGALSTLLQVVPATVVAIFIFAVGAVFIMVQIVGPTLGSRAIENLIVERRARACVIAGMVLLLACLVLAALARIIESKRPEPWEASAAAALALATLLYVPFSIWCISSVLHDHVSPDAYSTLLSKWRRRRGSAASELAFRQLRALRQWLRTACNTGESRDIVFALKGFQELLGKYCTNAGSKENPSLYEELHSEPPNEYSRNGEIVNSPWRGLLDPENGPPKQTSRTCWLGDECVPREARSRTGWFGDEFGRALARCAEVGIRSGGLLRRDLDRLLVVLGGATLQLAGFQGPEEERIDPKVQPLPEEAGFLLDRIAEIGMYAFQVRNEAYSDWFERPALVLASLEEKLEGLGVQVTGPPFLECSHANGGHQAVHGHEPLHGQQPRQEHCLAGRALAAWCLVNYTFQQSNDGVSTPGVPTAKGRHRLGLEATTSRQLWDEAKGLAMSTAMHPSWMPFFHDDPEGRQHLNTFFDEVQTLVRAKPLLQNHDLAVDLDDWVLGGSFRGYPTMAHWQDYSATTADGVPTLCAAGNPCGEAFLGRGVTGASYRGARVTFRGEVHAEDVTGRAELRLQIFTPDRSHSVQKYSRAITASDDWTSYELTAYVPGDAELIRFSLALTGPGRVALRRVELTRTS